jgi:serine/threonine protein kinase
MNENEIKERIEAFTGSPVKDTIIITSDTSNYMDFYRGAILDLNGELYYILGNMHESRFTLEEYPKYWVKSAIELSTGRKKIIKWDFNEKFIFKIGQLNIKCYRSSEKESRILEIVNGNISFMQGRTVSTNKGEPVKIIDFIKGEDLYHHLSNLDMDHEEYFHEQFPVILSNLRKSLEAIEFIHKSHYVHGDIRNDHLLIDEDLKTYRWIDFDLNQDFSDFDIWSLGNILLFCTGKGEHTVRTVAENKKMSKNASASICEDDVSAFFTYRIINLKKLFPYIPTALNDILMHFSKNTALFYESVDQIITDVDEVLTLWGHHGSR